MRFEVAKTLQDGQLVALVLVTREVVKNRYEAERVIREVRRALPQYHILLMARSSTGFPSFYGSDSLIQKMRDTSVQSLKWERHDTSQPKV